MLHQNLQSLATALAPTAANFPFANTGTGPAFSGGELVVIDQSVAGWQEMLADLQSQQAGGRDLQWLLLDSRTDGLLQLSQALAGYRNLSALHIISHGDAGQIQLGNHRVTADSLSANATAIAGWRSAWRPVPTSWSTAAMWVAAPPVGNWRTR